jgi:hypothetical protein
MTEPLSPPLTVFVTLKVWGDKEGHEPIADAVENALRPLLDRGESMQIDIQER